ncbi:DUF6843 domain-containing protein [Mucilaginibacter polytrichastri]|nr:hypothetical protein [Mucilaginibacter polytrichastri]SFS40550.1 hypothetical protein SAMN04487890_101311 [Mucilaginibacter polytrichastri]
MRRTAIIYIIIFLSSCKFAEKQKYLFPDNYCGNIYIFTNVKNGSPKQYYAGNIRIYSVFQSGILLSQFKETYGITNKRFFFKTKNGNEIEFNGIPFQDDKASLDSNKVYAFYGNDTNITFPKSKDTVGIQIVTICKPKNFNNTNQEPFKKILVGSHFLPEDITYERLINIRNKANKLIKNTVFVND